jgi:SPP1 gp7 family putative phage head morphogenesis protein
MASLQPKSEDIPVNTSVITDQLKQKGLDPKTEAKIKQLLGKAKSITQKQALILQSIIDDAIREISATTDPLKLAKYGSINIFQTPTATTALISYAENITTIFNFGIQFSNKTPSTVVKSLEEAVKQSSMDKITKMGNDLKTKAGDILANGIKNELPTNQISKQLQHELQISKARANSIVRTETMRAAHAGSYGQAKRDGMNYYIVDPRAEACNKCHKFYLGRVFAIEDSSGMPPFHINCACIPVYFRTMEEAQGYADNISSEVAQKRQDLTDKGLYLPPDGTGPLQEGAPGWKDPSKL